MCGNVINVYITLIAVRVGRNRSAKLPSRNEATVTHKSASADYKNYRKYNYLYLSIIENNYIKNHIKYKKNCRKLLHYITIFEKIQKKLLTRKQKNDNINMR